MTAPLTLEDLRGKEYPEPGSQQVGVSGGLCTDYVYRLIGETDAAAQERYRKAARNLLFADGRQWIDWTRQDRVWRDIPVPDGKIRTTANYIRPILRSRQQRVLSADFQWRVEPRTNAHEERDRATVAERLLTTRYRKTDMDGKVRLALFLADNCGVSYLKSYWNNTIGPRQHAMVTLPHPVTGEPTDYPVSPNGAPLMDAEGNPMPDDQAFAYRPGDTDTAVRTLFNIRLNPDATGLEPDEGFRWLLDMDLVPISKVKEMWGHLAKDVNSGQGSALLQQYTRLVAALGPLSFGAGTGSDSLRMTTQGQRPEDLVLLTEYWEDRSEVFPQGRLLVNAGSVLLYDGPLPQGIVPHTAIYCERRPYDAYGRPVVDDLVPPQRTLNVQLSALLTQLEREGIGQWMGFQIPGLAEQITNTDGSFIGVPLRGATANRNLGDVLQRVPPTPWNQARITAIELSLKQMFDIGAFHEIQRGQVPPGVDSGIAVQLLMEAENAQLNDTVRQLMLSLIRWGRHQTALARWGYGDSEQRWLPAGDESLNFLVESVSGTDLPDPEDIDISLDGFKPQSTAAYRAEVKEAVSLQILTPREGIDLLDLGRGLKGAFASEGRQYAKARRENLALERGNFFLIPSPPDAPTAGNPAFMHEDGSPFLLPSLDDHERHILVHNEIALDDTKPWSIRQAVILHITEHQTMQQQQVAAEMALRTPPPDQPTEGPNA